MKKNLVKKAVLPALVALLCSVVALTSVSYAWFTMGNQATVDEMQLNVTTSEGLQISATGNADSYKSLIKASEFDTAELKAKGNNFPTSVSPVSTDGSYSAGTQAMFKGTINREGKLWSSADDTKNYIVFDLYIQASTNYTLVLDKGSSVTSATETHKASRVSFINLGFGKTAADAQNLVLTELNGTAKIWEPNFKERATVVKTNQINGHTADSVDAIPYFGLNKAIAQASAMTLADVNKADSGVSKKVEVLAPAYDGTTGATTDQKDLFA